MFVELLNFKRTNLGLGLKEVALKSNLEVSRVNEIFKGLEPSVKELNALAIALQMDKTILINKLTGSFGDLPYIPFWFIEDELQHKNWQSILNLFISGRIIIENQKLYLINASGKALKEIPDEMVEQMFDLLLFNDCASTVLSFSTSKTYLKINRLSDLDKYGTKIKEEFIYGIKSRKRMPPVCLPPYFVDLVNHLNEEEQEIVMLETRKRIQKYIDSIKSSCLKNMEIAKFEQFYAVGKDNSFVSIKFNDFNGLNRKTKCVESIIQMQEDFEKWIKHKVNDIDLENLKGVK